MRFSDRQEASASLALRERRVEALGFYFDRDRVHAGSAESVQTTVLEAWIRDTTSGQDSIMLAGTREEVSELNRRARPWRLRDTSPGRPVELADGNQASARDVVLTRMNDRRLAISATDWVKNGDRWLVNEIQADGSIRVHHLVSGLRSASCRLRPRACPADPESA